MRFASENLSGYVPCLGRFHQPLLQIGGRPVVFRNRLTKQSLEKVFLWQRCGFTPMWSECFVRPNLELGYPAGRFLIQRAIESDFPDWFPNIPSL